MSELYLNCSSELRDMLNKDEDLMNFFHLIKKLNSLTQVSKQSSSNSRCLYEAVSKEMNIRALEQKIENFFSPLQKPAGTNLPVLLKFNKTVRMLSGVRKDQSFFMKKTSVGEIYGALWPWQSEPQNVTILLGLNGDRIKDDDYQQLEELVEQVCI